MKNVNNILVLTDFSSDSQAAVREAALIAGSLHSRLYVLHTVENVQQCAADYCLTEEQVESEKNRLLGEAQSKLRDTIKQIDRKGKAAIIPEVRYGYAFDEIMKEEKEKNIDMLIMAAGPKRSLWRRFFSHLTFRLIKNSSCDTLLVKHVS